MPDLPERMLALRKEKKLTQEEAAKQSGIVLRTYCRYEKGERAPTVPMLWKLADFYDVSIDYLVGRTDSK